MAVLRQCRDGHYIIVGPWYGGAPLTTHQVSEEGLRLLRSQGYHSEDRVPSDILTALNNQGLFETGKTGVGEPTGPCGPGLTAQDIRRLVDWAKGGTDERIRAILATTRVPPNCWYLPACLVWFASIEGGVHLSDLLQLSPADLYASCRDQYDDSPSFFEQLLHENTSGAARVLWRLAQLIARAAAVAEHQDECPKEWANRVQGDVFSAIREFLRHDGTTVPQQRGARFAYPRLLWQVDLQRVVLMVPFQRLPTVCSVQWKKGSRSLGPVSVHREDGKWVLAETVSEPLPPFHRLSCVVCYSASDTIIRRSLDVDLPETEALLFNEREEFVDPSNGGKIPPGQYSALFPPGFSQREIDKINLGDEYVCEPGGWGGWRAAKVRLSIGDSLGQYRCDAKPSLLMQLEGNRLSTVEFASSYPPVYVGDLPLVIVRSSLDTPFVGAGLEVVCEDDDAVPVWLSSGMAEDRDSSRAFGLKGEAKLERKYGRFTLRLIALDQEPEVLKFVRIPDLVIRYVPDPVMPTQARAVEIEGDGITLQALGESVLVCRNIVRAQAPERSPEVEVYLVLDRSPVRIRLPIRVPVTRVRIRDREHLGEWQLPPMEIDLAGVRREARLEAQFHTPPELVDDELFCYLLSGRPVAGGKPSKKPGTFDITLANWNDYPGPDARDAVRVRCEDGWITLASLKGRENRRHTATPPVPMRLTLARDIDEALLATDWSRALDLADRAAERSGLPSYPTAYREILAVHSARAYLLAGKYDKADAVLKALGERKDLPEALLLAAQMHIRSSSADAAVLAGLANYMGGWPPCPQKALAQAECYYRMSKLCVIGANDGCLKDALDLLEMLSGLDDIDQSQAVGLTAIIRFILARKPVKSEILDCRMLAEVGQIVEAGTLSREYIATALPDWDKARCMRMPESTRLLRMLYDAKDLLCLQGCIAQAKGDVKTSGEMLSQLADHRGPADLLRARHELLERRVEDATRLYCKIFDRYDVVRMEMPGPTE